MAGYYSEVYVKCFLYPVIPLWAYRLTASLSFCELSLYYHGVQTTLSMLMSFIWRNTQEWDDGLSRVCIFIYLKNLHTVFHNDLICLHSLQQRNRVYLPPHSPGHLLFPLYFIFLNNVC